MAIPSGSVLKDLEQCAGSLLDYGMHVSVNGVTTIRDLLISLGCIVDANE